MKKDLFTLQAKLFTLFFGAVLLLQFILWLLNHRSTEWLDILGILALVGMLHGMLKQYRARVEN
jgi:hypothetical protein